MNIEIIRIIRMNYLFVIHSNNIFLIFIQQAKLRGGQKSRNVPNHVDHYDNIEGEYPTPSLPEPNHVDQYDNMRLCI